jgi:HNH endonuclease
MTTRKRVAPDLNRLDRVVADARKVRAQREQGYRAQALKLYPWICGRCAREFQHSNLHELTVHHKNHNHDDNPADGSNWELLCLYCHDNEHQRQLENSGSASLREEGPGTGATHSPFADLASLLRRDE